MRTAPFTFLLFVFFIYSCGKDDKAPVINMTSPIDGAIVERGKTYPIAGVVTDDTELSEVIVGGTKITPLDSKTSHVIKDFTFTISPTDTLKQGSLVISAKDKEGNEAVETISLTIK